MSPIRRRRTPLAAIVLLTAVAAVGLFLHRQVPSDSAASRSSAATGPSTGAAPTGPTSAGAPAGPDAAAAAVTSSAPFTIKAEPRHVASDPPRTTAADQAQVVLTYTGYQQSARTVQANGYVVGVIENGGTCTLTLTRGSAVVTASSTAVADATTTSCGLMETSPGIASGTWQAVLTYSSAVAHSTSAAQSLVVP